MFLALLPVNTILYLLFRHFTLREATWKSRLLSLCPLILNLYLFWYDSNSTGHMALLGTGALLVIDGSFLALIYINNDD